VCKIEAGVEGDFGHLVIFSWCCHCCQLRFEAVIVCLLASLEVSRPIGLSLLQHKSSVQFNLGALGLAKYGDWMTVINLLVERMYDFGYIAACSLGERLLKGIALCSSD